MPIFPEQSHARSPWRGVYQSLVGIAAVAATAILLLANLQLNRQIDATQQQLALAETQLQQTQGTLDLAQNQTQATNEQVALIQNQLLQVQRDAAELKTVNSALQEAVQQQTNDINLLTTANRLLTLAGLGVAEQAQGTFIVSNNEVILTVRGLSPLPADKTYQLWYIPEGGDPEPADLFAVQAGDSTRVKFPVAAETTFANIGITIEPAGGSLTPTELVLLSTT